MRESIVETILGAVVIAVAAFFMWFSLSETSEASSGARYEVLARFNNINGIERGTDVRLAGMKIGVVKATEIDPKRFEARVSLAIDEGIELPDDSDAKIVSDGLLGGAYVAIEPGGSFDNIAKDGSGEIIYTRGAVDLLTLFGSLASGSGDDSAGSGGADAVDYGTGSGSGSGSGSVLDGLEDFDSPPPADDDGAGEPSGDGE